MQVKVGNWPKLITSIRYFVEVLVGNKMNQGVFYLDAANYDLTCDTKVRQWYAFVIYHGDWQLEMTTDARNVFFTSDTMDVFREENIASTPHKVLELTENPC